MPASFAEPKRRDEHQRNPRLERLLEELNACLPLAQDAALPPLEKPDLPVLFVVGAPRSGTTLLMQWLADMGLFAYPTNLLSRFYAAPYIGARIQQLLTDPAYQHGDELFDLGDEGGGFESELGKTTGALQPNEFWYFWRRFIPNTQLRPLTSEEVEKVDVEGLRAGFASIEHAFGKPLALKGLILQYNLSLLAQVVEEAVFIHLERDLFYNAQSLLQAREKYYGDLSEWWSVQPPQYNCLKEKTPYEQVVGQVHHTNKSIHEQLSALGGEQSVDVWYEDFCDAPEKLYNIIRERFLNQGFSFPDEYNGPEKFRSTNQCRLPAEQLECLRHAESQFAA